MIVNNFPIVMAKKRKFKLKDISQSTGISRNTLYALKHGRTKGIQYETLDALCTYFNVDVSEILEFVNDAS